MQISTITLNSKNYSTSSSMVVDNDVLDVNDFIVVKGRTYFANKKRNEGVSKHKRSMMSI